MALRLTIVCTSCLSAIKAQTQYKIEGFVTDSVGQPLPSANVFIFRRTQAEIKTFGVSDSSGYYHLSFQTRKDTAHHYISVTMLGYRPVKIRLDLNPEEAHHTVDFVLKEQALALNTVTISSDHPIEKKGDTLIYSAESYQNGSENNLEDVLKKLPGVQVSQDGTVSVNGKQIKSLMIEGEDLFEENYRVGIKNIPANLIDKVEAIDHHQHDPLLKGLASSEEMVLNLTLKKDKKSIVFGNAEGGYGPENWRDVKANLFLIEPRHKLYTIGQHNNIGFHPIGLANSGETDKELRKLPISSLNRQLQLPDIPLNGTSLDNSEASLNRAYFSYVGGASNLTKKLKVQHITYFYRDLFSQTIRNEQTYRLEDTPLSLTEQKTLESKPQYVNSRVKMSYRVNARSRVDYLAMFRNNNLRNQNIVGTQSMGSRISLPLENLQENAHVSSRDSYNQLTYLLRPDSSWAFKFRAFYVYQQTPQEYTLFSERYADFFELDSSFNQLRQGLHPQRHTWGAQIETWLRKKSVKYTIESGYQHVDENLPTTLKLIASNTDNIFQPSTGFTNDYCYRTNRLFAKLTREQALFKNWNVKLSLSLDRLGAQRKDNLTFHTISQELVYLSPSLTLTLPFGENIFFGNYTYKRTLPPGQDFQNGRVLTNYRSFRLGTDQFIFPESHNLVFGYVLVGIHKGLFVNTFFTYIDSPQAYGFRSQINPLFSEQDLIPVSHNRNLIHHLQIKQYISPINTSLTLETQLSWALLKGEQNQIIQENLFYEGDYTLGLQTLWDTWVNFEVKASVLHRTFRDVAESEYRDTKATTYTYQFDNRLIFQPFSKKNWSLMVEWKHLIFRNNTGQATTYDFLNGTCSYKIIPKRLELGVSLTNLLDTNNFSQLVFTNNATILSQQEILPRVILGRVLVNF